MKKSVFILVAISIVFMSCQENIQPDSPKELEAASSKQLGKDAFIKGDYFKALDYYYQALEYYRELNDPMQISKITGNIGSIYSQANFPSMALNFYLDAFEQRKQLDDIEGIAKLYYNIGKALRKNHQNEEARKYLNLSDSIFSVLNISKYKPQILNDLGITYLSDSNHIEARKYFQYAMNTNHKSQGMVYNNIGYSYHLEGNDDLALTYYRKAIGSQNDLTFDIRTLLFNNIAKLQQNPDSVAWYYKKGFKKDLIWIDNIYLTTAHTLFLYHYKNDDSDSTLYYSDLEHQAALRGVRQRDELKSMFDLYQVKYAHYKEQTRQQAALLEKEQLQKNWFNGVISGILLFIILYYSYRNKKKLTKLKSILDKAPSIP